MSGWDLTAAEQRVWDGFPGRSLVDLRSGDPAEDDVAATARWGEDRTVRGEVISALLLGACPPDPGRVPALRLAGARVTGAIDVSQGDVLALLELTGCSLDSVPDFDGATSRPVHLTRCALPGFNGRLLHARGSVRFVSCTLTGCIILRNARLQSGLHLSDSHLACPGGEALSAGGDRHCRIRTGHPQLSGRKQRHRVRRHLQRGTVRIPRLKTANLRDYRTPQASTGTGTQPSRSRRSSRRCAGAERHPA